MTLTELVDDGLGDGSPAAPSPSPRHTWRWPLVVLATVVAAVVALVVLGIQTAVYLPLEFGGSQCIEFPGLPKTPLAS